MKNDLNAAYAAAVEIHGQEAADRAAEVSVAAFNTAALAGLGEDECAAEQLAAFSEEIGK